MKKREYKYIASTEQRDQLEAELQHQMEPDRTLETGGDCRVITQYFDSPERDCYWERIRKMKSRRKIRVRFCSPKSSGIEPAAFVEIKHKRGRVKGERRMEVPLEVARSFAAGDHEVLRGMLETANRGGRMVIHEVFDIIERFKHEPVIQIRFDRSAYISANQRLRISLDSGLVSRSGQQAVDSDEMGFENEVVDPNEVVVEVKVLGAVPPWFLDCAKETGLEQRRFSKYSAALQKFDPVLHQQLSEPGPTAQ